ncbi:hypothetical protein P171DRAFT_450062 [Karstenula rhodostoma CBS 690.94]|uniref:Uncharacterized protein n=1 Tax=Karstenula rhodostoma CBS 690.94 TaxID=1392251 RepID=A0A9P4P381_9PLEO|nr:hypothetical protein P171DRAFT_450062 [Karstenula rhodostoma CBS 690.94]
MPSATTSRMPPEEPDRQTLTLPSNGDEASASRDRTLNRDELKAYIRHQCPNAAHVLEQGRSISFLEHWTGNTCEKQIVLGQIEVDGQMFTLTACLTSHFFVKFIYDGGKIASNGQLNETNSYSTHLSSHCEVFLDDAHKSISLDTLKRAVNTLYDQLNKPAPKKNKISEEEYIPLFVSDITEQEEEKLRKKAAESDLWRARLDKRVAKLLEEKIEPEGKVAQSSERAGKKRKVT